MVVCSSRSGSAARLVDALVEGTASEGIEGVRVRVLAPLDAGPDDVRAADLVVLAAPPNLGMINGLMKDFLERIYYPCLEATRGRPFGVYLHGNDDVTGALRGIEKITTGLAWRTVHEPVLVTGAPGREDLDACWDLGATVAANFL